MKSSYLFTRVAGAFLLLAAMMLFLSNLAAGALAQLPDPLLGVSGALVFWIASGVFAVAAMICLFAKDVSHQLLGIIWVSVNFWCYKGALFWLNDFHHVKIPLGNLPDAFRLAPATVDRLAEISFGCLLVIGGSFLAVQTRNGRRRKLGTATDEVLKISCNHCGGHIAFSKLWLGRSINCPHCSRTITLPAP